jgi:PAS domain S-box-containing protein
MSRRETENNDTTLRGDKLKPGPKTRRTNTADLDIFRAIFEKNSAAIAILEADSTISMVNNAFCQMSGYSKEELIGESWIDKMPSDEVDRLFLFNKKRLRGDKDIPDKYEFTFYTKEGELKYGLLSASTIHMNGKTIVSFTDITQRKKAEEEQRISEEHYRSLVEYANDVVYSISSEGILTYSSPNWKEQLGHDLSEVVGHSFAEFVHADDFERLAGLISQNYKTAEKLNGIQYQIRHKDGRWRWYSSSSSPILNAEGRVVSIIGIAHDITEQKLAEEALLKSEALLNTLVKTIPDLVWLKDPEGTYLSCNTMFERFFGAKKEEIVGKTDYDFVDRELADFFRENDQKAIAKGIPSSNEEWITFADDGHRALLDTIKTPMYTLDGRLIGVLGIARDITKRKQAEQLLKESEAQLLELNATKDKFFSIIAHDLRNPFSLLVGLAEIMADENNAMSTEELRHNASVLYKTASSTFNLLENLLEWSRLQRGLSILKRDTIFLAKFIDNLNEAFSEMASKKLIKLTVNVPEDLSIIADPNMLHSILRNLVTNAIKFTNTGGMVSVSVSKKKDKKEIFFEIKDTGIGISPKMIDDLFRIDVNNTRPGTENEPSSGLGLILCKEFVEMHGGKIWVESNPDLNVLSGHVERGSTFSFTIPDVR